jgi:sugar/nucleoside kinase (ribokinase family)
MGKKIGCAGILCEDTFCGPMRGLPREGELLAIDGMPVKAGGCAANVAIDLAKQGLAVEVAGCLGRDGSADVLQGCLEKNGVGCRQVTRVAGPPTSKTVILLVAGQDRRYIHVFGANGAFSVGHIKRAWVESLDVFYLGGLFLMPAFRAPELRDLLRFCRARKIVTVVDVVLPRHWDGREELSTLLPEIDYFLPNHDEARMITGKSGAASQLKALAAAGANTVIITQGRAGATAARGGAYWRCGAYPAKVVDPSGSGDAFSAGVVTGLRRGWDLARTLRYGSALGASATRAVGTTDGVFSAQEAEKFIAEHPLEVKIGKL